MEIDLEKKEGIFKKMKTSTIPKLKVYDNHLVFFWQRLNKLIFLNYKDKSWSPPSYWAVMMI